MSRNDRHDSALGDLDDVPQHNSTVALPPQPQRPAVVKPKHVIVGHHSNSLGSISEISHTSSGVPSFSRVPSAVTGSPRLPSTVAQSNGAPSNGDQHSNGLGSGKRGFFGRFFSSSSRDTSTRRSNSSTALHASEQVGLLASQNSGNGTVPSTPSSASASVAAAAASSTAAGAPAPPARKWLRYPVRVPILALLLVSLLARTSEGWTSIGGFLCGFLLFEGFSAPDTGQPNRIDAWIRIAMVAIQKCRRKRKANGSTKPTRKEKRQERQELSRMRRVVQSLMAPCTWCCKRKPKHHERRHSHSGDLPETTNLLAAEEDTDVLLDVAFSVAEDKLPPAPPSSTVGSAQASRPETPAAEAQTPLHPLTNLVEESLTEELTEQLKESIEKIEAALPPLPTVTALDAADATTGLPAPPTSAATVGTVGGTASWKQMSISLRFTLYNFHIHLHHWVYLLIICLFLFLEQTYFAEHAASSSVYSFASAFCLGGSVQGLKYADWSHVIWRRQREQQGQSNDLVTASTLTTEERPQPPARRLSRTGATPRTPHARRVSSASSFPVAALLSPTSSQVDRMEAGQPDGFSRCSTDSDDTSPYPASSMPPPPIALSRATSAVNINIESAAQALALHV
jgi:hypothetical protein